METTINHIELFAGCGGLSLGLHAEQFKLLFANELSPMAAETFAYNLFNEDLLDLAKREPGPSSTWSTKWLSSKHSRRDLAQRLRENPQEFPPFEPSKSELHSVNDLQNSLVVGSIVHMNEWLSRASAEELERLRSGFGAGGVDVVSGGPPCQSFSMNGLRDYSNARNVLPWEFAKFVKLVQPRFALLENVTGILRPFQVDGKPVFAWLEVAKAFCKVGYVPLCLHVNAKYAGVAQNRPRFIMILFRSDVYRRINTKCDAYSRKLLASSNTFYNKVNRDDSVEVRDLDCFDVEKEDHLKLYKRSFLAPLVSNFGKEHTVAEAINDLQKVPSSGVSTEYIKLLHNDLGKRIRSRARVNMEHRNHGDLVQRRFRIYQNILELKGKAKEVYKEVRKILRGDAQPLSNEAFLLLSTLYFITEAGNEIRFTTRKTMESFLVAHSTKKQKQSALDAGLPAPAALSIPDDACHYYEPRTLSVREMARIQSFPDNFEFRSKVTTGGESRKYEVPQYTQVGNAVPPLLGIALGKVIRKLDALEMAGATDAENKNELQVA